MALSAAALAIPDSWEEPEALRELIDAFRAERHGADVSRIRRAYYVAEVAHKGQTRRTGDPYVTHPLAVATILASLKMDEESIVAGLLHDVLEDTEVIPEQVSEAFGPEILALVEGVTKMSFPPLPRAQQKRQAAEERARFAETMRKMLMAMANDFRVMVIKLADRLHNMQTLHVMPEEKRLQIAQQTIDIYAPLAARLGIWQVKWQLEDLAFQHLHGEEYEEIGELIAKSRKEREQELAEAIVMLKERLEHAGIHHAELQGRPKHLYSIYEKMAVQGFEFEEIYDLLGIRVLTDSESDCYQALGIVHDLWKPIPGLFYDYVAKPKSNGYQSLHTKVVGPHGEPMEVQIRTHEMHRMAEFGIAAHWQYKSRGKGRPAIEEQARIARLRQQLFDWSSEASTGSEFLRSVSLDLFSEQVFAFTPKGDVIDLPLGSTPIDFAFRIHTEVGLKTVGAKVNGRIVKLDHELENGDIVEVMTRGNAQPSVDWLRSAKTVSARSKIRGFLRQQNRDANAQRGRDALERELKSLGYEPKAFLGEEKLKEVATALKKKDATDLLAKVGEGLVGVTRVVSRLTSVEVRHQKLGKKAAASGIQTLTIAPGGAENVAFRRSKCCLPVPGDEVVGYVSKGRGMILHRKLCPNAQALLQQEPNRMMRVDWPSGAKGGFSSNLRIQTVNRQGLLADISAVLGETKTNVSAAKIRTLPNQTALLELTVDVADSHHLQSVIGKISSMQDVISIQRMFTGKGRP